jgi:hypothetical protein
MSQMISNEWVGFGLHALPQPAACNPSADMKKILILLGLLAACSSQEEPRRDGNPMAPAAAQKQSAPADEPSGLRRLPGFTREAALPSRTGCASSREGGRAALRPRRLGRQPAQLLR